MKRNTHTQVHNRGAGCVPPSFLLLQCDMRTHSVSLNGCNVNPQRRVLSVDHLVDLGGGDSSQIPVLNGNLDGSLITFHFVDLVHLTCQSSGSAYDDLSPLVTRMFRTPDSPDQGSRRHPSCVSCPVSLLLSHPFITFSFNYNVNTRV